MNTFGKAVTVCILAIGSATAEQNSYAPKTADARTNTVTEMFECFNSARTLDDTEKCEAFKPDESILDTINQGNYFYDLKITGGEGIITYKIAKSSGQINLTQEELDYYFENGKIFRKLIKYLIENGRIKQ